MNHEMADYLKAVICSLAPLDRESITVDQDIFLDLGVDSVSALQILAAIESRYNIRLKDWDLDQYNTIAKIVDRAQSYLPKE